MPSARLPGPAAERAPRARVRVIEPDRRTRRRLARPPLEVLDPHSAHGPQRTLGSETGEDDVDRATPTRTTTGDAEQGDDDAP